VLLKLELRTGRQHVGLDGRARVVIAASAMPQRKDAMPHATKRGLGRWEPLAAKVPEITVIFWVLKVLTTGMGESMSDFLSHKSIPLDAAVGVLGFVVAMSLQLRSRRYRAPGYWFAVMMVAVFGTIAADGVHKGAGVPYALSTPVFAVAVGAIFFVWHRTEGTLSIHSVTTLRREVFYWCAVLATFALGTAAGDLTAYSLNLGFLSSTVLFALLIALPAVAWWRGKLNPIVAFWAAYVVTRPLGASIADWFGKPHASNGLGIGDGTVSGVAFICFVVLVGYVTATGRDTQRGPSAAAQTRPAEGY
jgi:uncharacterized membrane-anchored protein